MLMKSLSCICMQHIIFYLNFICFHGFKRRICCFGRYKCKNIHVVGLVSICVHFNDILYWIVVVTFDLNCYCHIWFEGNEKWTCVYILFIIFQLVYVIPVNRRVKWSFSSFSTVIQMSNQTTCFYPEADSFRASR